jgi:catechol 2,3-dioxygenase-like lactoylglutathione lyase family enzyme
MNTLHHPHLMATDIDATIAFWRDGFGGHVVDDVEFAGARNVFMRVGHGRLHLYAQPPRTVQRGTVHHLGVQTGELDELVARLHAMGVSVTDIRDQPGARYAMAEGPDGLLVELFEPDLEHLEPTLRDHFHTST